MAIPTDVEGTWFNTTVSLDAGEARRADAAMFAGDGTVTTGAAGGVVRHADTSLAVSVDGSDVVTVQPGTVVVPGNAVAGTGPYRLSLASAITGSLAARNATNPRITLVIFRAYDDDVVGTHNAYKGTIEFVNGTPAGSPSAPALPSMAVELARITVPNTGGGAATVSSANRTYATSVGAVMAVPTSTQLPASAVTMQNAVALDTGIRYRWNGSAWVGGWNTLSLGGGFSGVTVTPACRADGNVVHFRGFVSGTYATSSSYTIVAAGGIPAALRPSQREDFLLASATGNAGVTKCEVGTDGSITVRTSTTAPNTYVALSPITYLLG